MLLPENGINSQMGSPEALIDVVGRGIGEVGEDERLASQAAPMLCQYGRACGGCGFLLLQQWNKVGAREALVGALIKLLFDCLGPPVTD